MRFFLPKAAPSESFAKMSLVAKEAYDSDEDEGKQGKDEVRRRKKFFLLLFFIPF